MTRPRASCRCMISDELRVYLQRLRAAGLARGDWNPRAAAAMLMGVLFTDAMGRDCMPERFPYSEREGIGTTSRCSCRPSGSRQAARRAEAPAPTPVRRLARATRAKSTASRR